MKKWEYFVCQDAVLGQVELNNLGRDGWELFFVDRVQGYFFKRQLTEKQVLHEVARLTDTPVRAD